MCKMPYTDAVIRESMRLSPIVNMLWRTAVEDFELGGYKVPAGWRVVTSLKKPLMDIPGGCVRVECVRVEAYNTIILFQIISLVRLHD